VNHPADTLRAACAHLTTHQFPTLAEGTPGGDWVRVDQLTTSGRLVALLEAAATCWRGGRRGAGGVVLVAQVARAVLGYPLAGLLLADRAPDISPDNVWLRWQDGLVREATLRRATTAVLAGSPDAGHPDAVRLFGMRTLDDWTASRAAAALAPTVEAVREHGRVSRRVLWGTVIDAVFLVSTAVAKDSGIDTHAAWERAERFVTVLGRYAPLPNARPRAFPLAYDGFSGVWPVRTSCCFFYKSEPDSPFCGTCPLEDDTRRAERFAAWLRQSPPAPHTLRR
jgi:hypothetical protein